MKKSLIILNKKETKKILEEIQNQYGIKKLELDYVFLRNNKNKIYITNKNIGKLDLNNFKINNIGLYFADVSNKIRLSIEGSQLVGKNAKKNVLEINEEEVQKWLRGYDLNTKKEFQDFVIIKHKDDYLGTGKYKENKILNFVSKDRRIK
ncbi:hypothetical protein K8R47_02450 [archaeon]|nr:hypothetical protein [archaeon]